MSEQRNISQDVFVALREVIADYFSTQNVGELVFALERESEFSRGDIMTNVAMKYAGRVGKKPLELAQEIATHISGKNLKYVAKAEAVAPGFVNIFLTREYFSDVLATIDDSWGRNGTLSGTKAIFEYTDPNPFKEFHIGHLLPNTVGESLSRIAEYSGAEVKRVNYQGDVGMHVAKAIWGYVNMPSEIKTRDKNPFETEEFFAVNQWGIAYKYGNAEYERADTDASKKAITELNKKIYDRSDLEINKLYDQGRQVSLDYFETIYARLGTKFDHYFFESESAGYGKEIVEKNTPAIFEYSDGAVVYKGDEAMGLHTRVFINKEGLPTYEAKELGLAKLKYDFYPYDHSVIVTSNEIVDYFKVLLDAMAKVYQQEGFAQKTKHIAHGTLRLPEGKMSSRTGNVITALSLIEEASTRVREKISSERGLSEDEIPELIEMVAIGAIKFAILRQEVGKDMIFDFDRSLSFEGDSGPYLQYAHTRAVSLLEKAGDTTQAIMKDYIPAELALFERLLPLFPETVARASREYAPHHIVTYLLKLAGAFNSWYANERIIGSKDEAYKLSLVSAFAQTMKNGLLLLGIHAPKRM